MTAARRVFLLVVLLALFAPAHASAATQLVPAPLGLHGFLLRADEPLRESFARTPSFAWSPVPGATRYEFELSTDEPFADIDRVWSGSVAKTPAISIPMSLPWMTGKPYALYARVRAVTKKGVSGWSQSFGFNMKPETAAVKKKDEPGLLRWNTIDGATSYEVWFLDIGKVVTSVTNAVDEREFYTFHQEAPWPSVVRWRVRAVRALYGGLPNGLPAAGYGAWSQPYTSLNPPFQIGPATLRTTVSENLDAMSETVPHAHTPSFLFSGNQTPFGGISELYRVYVATDRDCINIVYRGAIVGSPAYSPRPSGTLKLPQSAAEIDKARTSFLADGDEGKTAMVDGTVVKSSEAKDAAGPAAPPSSGPPATPSASFALPAPNGAAVDLWDSGWPNGRYYWTIVPVRLITSSNGAFYQDLELPQDACAAGRVASFGKKSDPVVASERSTRAYEEHAPFASGLSSDGKLVSASADKPVFYGSPLVSWQPALGAVGYEVQWSKTLYPWKSADKSVFTFGTSALLQGEKALTPGTWWYRVRGLDPYLPGAVKEMSWSDPVRVEIAKPVFSVITPSNPSKKTKPAAAVNVVKSDGFAVGVPGGWRWVDRRTLAAELKRNPKLKEEIRPEVLAQLADAKSDLRLLGYDTSFNGNAMTVRVSPLGPHTHAQFLRDLPAGMRKSPELRGPVSCTGVTLPAGKGLRCTFRLGQSDKGYVEDETVYAIDKPGAAFILQFACPGGQRARFAAAYAASAKTFRPAS